MPPGTEAGSGDEPLDAAISPDGTTVAFVATRDGTRQLWLRRLDAADAAVVPGTDGAHLPAWKQTGDVISFFADGRLKVVTTPRFQTSDLAAAHAAEGATWLADGSLVFADGSPGPLRRMRDGEEVAATTLGAGDHRHAFPVAVAGRDAFVYVAVREDGRRLVRLSAGGPDRDLTVTSGHAALVSEQLLHVRDGALLAYPRDPETGALAPRGTLLALDVGISQTGRALFTAGTHLLLHARAAPRPHVLAWLDTSGTRLGTAGDAGEYWQVRLSPDDRLAAVTTTDPLLRALDIVLQPTAGAGAPVRLTTALAADTDPVWSPDGLRVLFRSLGTGRPDVFSRRIDGGDPAYDEVLASELDETPTDWTRDGILFHARTGADADVFELPVGGGTYQARLDTPFNESDARVSPDGRWIAFVSDESGRPDVYAQRTGGPRLRLSFGGGTRPRWTASGRAVLFLRGSQLLRADMTGERFTDARELFDAEGIRDFDVAHRSNRLLAILPVAGAAMPVVSALLNWRPGEPER